MLGTPIDLRADIGRYCYGWVGDEGERWRHRK